MQRKKHIHIGVYKKFTKISFILINLSYPRLHRFPLYNTSLSLQVSSAVGMDNLWVDVDKLIPSTTTSSYDVDASRIIRGQAAGRIQ